MEHNGHTQTSEQLTIPGVQPPETEASQPQPPPTVDATPEYPAEPPPKHRIPRKVVYLLSGLGLAGLLVYAFRPQPVAVDLAPVTQGPLEVTVNAEGQTRVQNRYTLAAPVEGRLLRVDLEAGDPVTAGEVVARIDPLPYTAQVEQAQARLAALQAQMAGVETQRPKASTLAQARDRIQQAEAERQAAVAEVARLEAALAQDQREQERATELHRRGAISSQELEAAQLAETVQAKALNAARRRVQSAAAAVQAAQNELQTLQAEQQDPDYLLDVYRSQMAAVEAELALLADDAQRTDITAPADGQVLRVDQQSSRYIAAGTPILEVGNARSLELVIDVLSTDATRIQPGNLIHIDHWGGDEPLTGRVRSVEPSAFTKVSALGVEEQRVNIIGDLATPHSRLQDGYRIDARIVVWQSDSTLQVPLSALFRCEETTWCTFVAVDGRAQRRPIEVGPRSDFAAAVDSGLTAGEQVILHPTDQIEDGRRIQAR